MPVTILWNESGPLDLKRVRMLAADETRELFRHGRVQFVVADLGKPLQWLRLDDCFDDFKRDLRSHIADPEQQTSLSSFPGEYCYFASLWQFAGADSIVLLERHH